MKDKMQQNTINRKVRVLLGSHHFSFTCSSFYFKISLQLMHSTVSFSCRHFTRPLFQILHPAKMCDCKLQMCQTKALVYGSGWEKSLDTAKHLWLAELITALKFPSAISLGTITTSSHQRPLVHWRRYRPNSKFTFIACCTTGANTRENKHQHLPSHAASQPSVTLTPHLSIHQSACPPTPCLF